MAAAQSGSSAASAGQAPRTLGGALPEALRVRIAGKHAQKRAFWIIKPDETGVPIPYAALAKMLGRTIEEIERLQVNDHFLLPEESEYTRPWHVESIPQRLAIEAKDAAQFLAARDEAKDGSDTESASRGLPGEAMLDGTEEMTALDDDLGERLAARRCGGAAALRSSRRGLGWGGHTSDAPPWLGGHRP